MFKIVVRESKGHRFKIKKKDVGYFLIVLHQTVKVAAEFSEGKLPHMVYLVHEMWQLDSCVCFFFFLNCHINK